MPHDGSPTGYISDAATWRMLIKRHRGWLRCHFSHLWCPKGYADQRFPFSTSSMVSVFSNHIHKMHRFDRRIHCSRRTVRRTDHTNKNAIYYQLQSAPCRRHRYTPRFERAVNVMYGRSPFPSTFPQCCWIDVIARAWMQRIGLRRFLCAAT